MTGGAPDAAWRPDGRGWHVRHDDEVFALTRRLPLRWDVAARATLPDLGRRRLAHAIRQDMWRMLARVRGFAPAVRVERELDGLAVTAGGRVAGRVPQGLGDRIAAMLNDAERRAAWITSARHRK